MNGRMSDKKKRKLGAILATAAVIVVMVIMIVAFLWSNSEDPVPRSIIVLYLIIFGGIIAGVIIALKQRLDELKEGEIDEATKY